MKYDVLIIGAGAAGLMAANILSAAGRSVGVLEAAPLPGGRMATIKEPGFEQPVETGAEFVHGKLPLTLELLKKAGIEYSALKGKMLTVEDGHWIDEAHEEHWEKFMAQLYKLEEDMSIQQFLHTCFAAPEYKELRHSVQRFAEGFDLADTTKASAFAAREEWGEDEETQYFIPGGYIHLTHYLVELCKKQHASFHFSTAATHVRYADHIAVTTHTGESFEAGQLIVTSSAGVLQSGDIKFDPPLNKEVTTAISQLGFGAVIKVLLQFKTPFWEERDPHARFFLTNEEIPTWWTQSPVKSNLLTGWLGGPNAAARSADNSDAILTAALASLSNIFAIPVSSLRQMLIHQHIACWHNSPYVKGGYSFNTIHSFAAKEVLARPVKDKLWFAGEALHTGTSQGTVEAALQHGRLTAEKILAGKN